MNAARRALSSHPGLKLLYPTDAGAGFAPAMTLAQAQLSAAGASATLNGTTTLNLQATLFGSGNWDVALVPLGVSAPTQLISFLSGATPPNGVNFAGINNGTYGGQGLDAALKTTGATSCRHWLNAEKAIFKQADLAPTMSLTIPTFAKGAKFGSAPMGFLQRP